MYQIEVLILEFMDEYVLECTHAFVCFFQGFESIFYYLAGNSQEVPSYEVPYASIVPDNPAIEDMKKVVVEDEYRPCIDPTWKNNEVCRV